MPKILYTPEEFPLSAGPLFLSTQELTVSWGEIAWAALTVGRRNFSDAMADGVYSILEAQ
jgi:hypothetical protein